MYVYVYKYTSLGVNIYSSFVGRPNPSARHLRDGDAAALDALAQNTGDSRSAFGHEKPPGERAKGVAAEPESDPAMGAAVMRARCRLPAVSWPNDIYALATGPATGIALCLMWLDLAWRCSLLARDMLAGERALAPHSW